MKLIKYLSDRIEAEISDACSYIDEALQNKHENPEVAEQLYELSLGEMEDMDTLHGMVVKLIEKYREEHGEPPEKMMWRYEYLHERHIADATKVKVKQGMFKEA